MTDMPSSHAHHEYLLVALEASCDTLISLRLIHALTMDGAADLEAMRSQAATAIESLGHCVSQLRLALAEGTGSVPLGFVLRSGWGSA